jgi:transposase-like protein
MRPVSVFAKGPGSEIEQLRAQLQGRWRQAARAVMVLLSLHGLPPSQIAKLLDCHPATVRRWISRFNSEGLADRGPCPGSGATWAGRRSARGRCTGESG